jgi:hypothetical protein
MHVVPVALDRRHDLEAYRTTRFIRPLPLSASMIGSPPPSAYTISNDRTSRLGTIHGTAMLEPTRTRVMKNLTLAVAGLFLATSTVWTQPSDAPLERYRNLTFPPREENFAKGWQDRVEVEFDVVNRADTESLRAALKDKDALVRSIAARALGIRGDKASADALAELFKSDSEYMVRIRVVESLAYLKLKPEIIELAKKDRDLGVQWTAKIVAGQLTSDIDHGAVVRKAFAAGIKRGDIGAAKVGAPAPDFTALTTDGKPFQLASVGKKPIAIYFAAFDG